VGYHNFTLTAFDGIGGAWLNASFTTMVHVVNTPPTIQGLSAITIEHGSTENITWLVTDPSISGIPYWGLARNGPWVAGNIGSLTNGQVIQFNVTGMAVGSYNFTLLVNDGYQNRTFTTMVSIVYDLPPRISVPADIAYAVGETGHVITWSFTDYNITTGWYAVYKDGVLQSNTTGWTGPTQTASIVVDGLARGVYTYTIVVSDGKGTSSDVVIITVTDPVMDAIIIALVIAGVAIVVAVVVAVKRKKAGPGKVKRKLPNKATSNTSQHAAQQHHQLAAPDGKVITCPSCGTPFTLTADYVKQYAGQSFKCSKCQASIPI
jgi:hypothetical protein